MPRIVRTALWAVGLGLLAWWSLPPLDALGRFLRLPPMYHTSARIFVGALWLVAVAAVWAYRPAVTPPTEGPPERR